MLMKRITPASAANQITHQVLKPKAKLCWLSVVCILSIIGALVMANIVTAESATNVDTPELVRGYIALGLCAVVALFSGYWITETLRKTDELRYRIHH